MFIVDRDVASLQQLCTRLHISNATPVRLFDGDTGALIKLSMPTGARSGNTVKSWPYALHMARVFGLPYQIFVCALGFLVTLLSVTGVYIRWKRSAGRGKFPARGGRTGLRSD